MDPELKELEPPSAGAGLETPGQQCPPNEGTWEKGRTVADGYLLVGMGSDQGGDISSPTERVDTRAVRTTANITFLQQGHKPKDKEKGSEKKAVRPWWGRRRVATAMGRGCKGSLFFSSREHWGWGARCLCFVPALFFIHCPFQVITSQRAESMRGDADQVADVRNRRASIFLPINPLKMQRPTTPGSVVAKMLWVRFDLVWFSSNAFFPRSCYMLKLVPGTLHSIQ